MKKILLIILVIIIAVAIYLNRAYAHIYNMIGEKNLLAPTEKNYTVGDKNAKNKIKIVFLGDSLTAGVGASSFQNTYPYLVAEKISQIEKVPVEVINLGTPGAKTIDVLNNQIKIANEFQPNKIYVFIGINDMHNRISINKMKNNLEKIITSLNLDKKNIYLINIPYLGSFLPPYKIYFDWQTKKYNQMFSDLKNTGVNFVDLFSRTKNNFYNDPTLYSTDLFHPNDNGYGFLANIIGFLSL